ncbi:MAG: hypothetical protein KIT11_05475 [Fimbriimonadaceae bacterium]|nr:hypothetical protein [Fimbriimonadaceae bacterium]QYK56657.1 MAG: hypothetical protein KF733_04045 [Fimbriimonadaceae bacterium]
MSICAYIAQTGRLPIPGEPEADENAVEWARYLLLPQEMWARAYAQYIAAKSRDKAAMEGVRTSLEGHPLQALAQWSDFDRIGEAVEEVLESWKFRKK